jgi:succinate dehydrogenase / fumarate reductase flavoprotein subunit
MKTITIIGAGLAGLSAAITAAQQGIHCILVSAQSSERAQSVLAEGGINAALNTKGEKDSPREHFEDTMKGGCCLADKNAVKGLTENAPDIVNWLRNLGVPFALDGSELDLRNFGGQKKKRTVFAKSSTGKMVMTAMIDEARKFEAENLIERLCHHEFKELIIENGECIGCLVVDTYTNQMQSLYGEVILATGGLNGLFGEATTGTTQNTGNAAAAVFRQGVEMGNLEMIQYHPTTMQISGKRMLISEAARGEGGRLYVLKNGEIWYFMEQLYSTWGNLAPRDVISREMAQVTLRDECGEQVYLDMRELSENIWKNKLSDLRDEIIHYKGIDPMKEPVPVEPGIHYFMGGILVNKNHQTNIDGLYAAGECTCQYHGANRLGGNSMLGAIYGGKIAALSAIEHKESTNPVGKTEEQEKETAADGVTDKYMQSALKQGLGIVRDEKSITEAIDEIETLKSKYPQNDKLILASAMLTSAKERKESRGAHYRSDFTEIKEEYQKTTVAKYVDGRIDISFRKID